MGSAKGLLSTTLPQHSAPVARQLLGDKVNYATQSPHWFEDLAERLRTYFDGHRVAFPDELDLGEATPFQRQVWVATRLIPYGQTRSYAWVAEQLRQPGAARAAGQALSRNPLPVIVPCHRVLKSDGSIGGFRGGVEMKRYLLAMEASASSR